MVTVQEKPWAAPIAMTWAPLMPYWPSAAVLSMLVELAGPGCGCGRRCRAAASARRCPAPAGLMRSWRSPESRTAPIALPTGFDGGRDSVLDRAEDGGGGLPGAVDR